MKKLIAIAMLAAASAAGAVECANLANYAGRDHLGRELVSVAEAGGEKGRQVGLFYYLWHGQHGTQGPYDISKMEAIDPKVMEKPDSPLWPDPSHTPMLHWGEPLFGYYLSTDEWVLRRHVQMFIDAGIDVLYFDTTNGYHYREVTEKLFAIMQEFHYKGYKVPKFFYYMAPARRGCGTSNVRDVWDNYYSTGRFRDLWFEWDGKPLIVTHPDRPYPQALLDTFTFRRPTWGTPSVPDTWYWGGMPTQNVAVASSGRREMLPVTVQTPHVGMDAPIPKLRGAGLGCSEAYWGAPIQGRSWRNGRRDVSQRAVEKGLFFQDQIDWALAEERDDIPLALVCQWNEWLVPFLTRKTNDLYAMPHWIRLQDEYNIEYSRDIEPMKDGYRDAYLFQLMNFVRRWKGLPEPAKGNRRYPAMSPADAGWNSVSPVFKEMTGDCAPRNHPGYDACGVYTNGTAVNEFASLRVAVGEDGVIRFHAETVKPVQIVDEKSMNLFLRIDGRPVDAMGYTHCLTPNGATSEADGKCFVYSVRADELGIDISTPFSIEFKWSDNRQSDDPMDFYVNGDAAPRGRLNWLFEFEPVAADCSGAVLLPAVGTTFKARPGTKVTLNADESLEVVCDGTYGWPGVELRPADGGTWDLSSAGVVEVVVRNLGENVELISAEAFPKNMNSGGKIPARCASVPPGATRLISVQIADVRVVTDVPVELEGTNGKIGSVAELPDFSETRQINVFQVQQGYLHPLRFAVLGVRTRFKAEKPVIVASTNFFPFCDRYGQFRHVDWPGKVHSDAELLAARDAEESWLSAHAASPIPGADKYGGWAGGPQLEATGFFRTEKVDGKWWLVDPEGHLFFSLGVTAVYAWTQTRVNGRENYFEWIPGTLAKSWRNDDKLVDFLAVNLARKYGGDFSAQFADMAQRRFHAWGINTIGNWSHEYIWALRRTPYVVTIDPSSNNRMAIRKKKGIGITVPDVYSPKFAEDVRAQLRKLAEKVKNDPWCVGVFVDNELDWESPDDIPDAADKYFSTVAAEVKAALPNHLYLGCRLVRFRPDVWRVAARYCDVVSFNFYERHPTWDLPSDAVDKPIIVGEFHFGALDRGHLAGGCVVTFDQNERAECFKDFVNACIDNPRYVGCHWFQYTDQAMTGRYYDGEAYQCGFVNVCDLPYLELVNACREAAAQMYRRRMTR